jgi:uncharacterized UPF0146 family protein
LETCRRIEGLVDFIAGRYHTVAEIGIGRFPDVIFALLDRGVDVSATDIYPFLYKGIKVFRDDVLSPDTSMFAGIELIYSMRPPPELVPYMKKLADTISADLIIKPLSSEYVENFRLMRNGDTTFFVCNYSAGTI